MFVRTAQAIFAVSNYGDILNCYSLGTLSTEDNNSHGRGLSRDACRCKSKVDH